ncbi:hypothetical protein MLD38_018914 [Melastoma candidum]|uniref:Uncharacterized protein n=1 Tax=Melastoma candidum TaxID=119954 RepID=A0ACB9QV89_9MYRT|nr:hypothetical protein MLD38_018914 [Melastoma candidum]
MSDGSKLQSPYLCGWDLYLSAIENLARIQLTLFMIFLAREGPSIVIRIKYRLLYTLFKGAQFCHCRDSRSHGLF